MLGENCFLKKNRGFPGGSLVKNLAANEGDTQETRVSSVGQEDSPGEGNGYPLQYSRLGNSVARGSSQLSVHGVSKSRARLRS